MVKCFYKHINNKKIGIPSMQVAHKEQLLFDSKSTNQTEESSILIQKGKLQERPISVLPTSDNQHIEIRYGAITYGEESFSCLMNSIDKEGLQYIANQFEKLQNKSLNENRGWYNINQHLIVKMNHSSQQEILADGRAAFEMNLKLLKLLP